MIDELKRRARAGDLQALQELRERGFFGQATAPVRSYAASAAQRRMWIVEQTSSNRAAYNLARALVIDGDLDAAAFTRALDVIVERHESLRTTFAAVDGEPRQIVHASRPISIYQADLRNEVDPQAAAKRLAAEDAPKAFDLATGPLLRVHLLRTADQQHVLLFNAHHIICDAWSLDNIVRELTALYRGEPPPALARQYKDFAVWHNDWLQSSQADADRRHWQRTLASPLPLLDLPSDRPRAEDPSWQAASLAVDLGRAQFARLRGAAASEGVTLFTMLVAVTKTLLHLESGQDDIVVGAPVAGREHADTEPLIGMFANAVALRSRINANDSFRSVLARTRRTVEDAFAHQGIPFDELVNELALERHASRSPIFDVFVGLLNTERTALDLGGLRLREFESGPGETPHDIVFYFAEGADTLHLSLLYRADLFDEATIRRMVARWQLLAERALLDADSPIRELELGASAFTASRITSAGGVDLDKTSGLIMRATAVVDAIVTPAPDSGALVAFVVPGDGSPVDAVTMRVKAAVPEIAEVVVISSMPLIADGRVNIRTLERLAAEVRTAAIAKANPLPLHRWDLVEDHAPGARQSTTASAIAPIPAMPNGDADAIATGESLAIAPGDPWTLGAALSGAANTGATITYLRADGGTSVSTYGELRAGAHRIAAALQRTGERCGAPVVILLPDSHDALPAFWGAITAGLVPLIASPPPDFTTPNRQLEHLAHIWTLLERPLIVTTAALKPAVESFARLDQVAPQRVLSIEDARSADPVDAIHQADPDDVAFFSLTSGSTGNPKCVMLTHRNALSRARGMNQFCECSSSDVVLNWLPFDHIGSLSDWHLRCVDLGCSAVYAPPAMMIGQPLQWLAALDRFKATHSWAPNFAYALVTDAVRAERDEAARYNLSHVEMLLTAGEAVTPAAVESFVTALAPFGLAPEAVRPAFGMAEMASGVTYGRVTANRAMRFHRVDRTSLNGRIVEAPDKAAAAYADLGPPIPGVSVRIVNEQGAVIPEWRIGRLQISGGPIAKGYYRDDDATRAVFLDDGWFDTGDYGFLANGCLALTGRAKDGIIVNGANYSSAEIESAVETVDGVTVSFVAAVAVRAHDSAEEALAIFYVPTRSGSAAAAKLATAIRQTVMTSVGIMVDYLVPVRRGDIPKTAIGKIQRARLVSQFEQGLFDDIVKHTDRVLESTRTIPDWFHERIWQREDITHRRLPGDAVVAVSGDDELAGEISRRGMRVATCDSIAQLIAALQPLTQSERRDRTTILIATVGGQIVTSRDALSGDRAGFAAIALSIAQECPWLDIRCVDLERDTAPAGADRCIEELRGMTDGSSSAWRTGRRFVQKLTVSHVALDPVARAPFERGALVLVAGGAGGVGPHVVKYLRDAFDARVLIVGRSADHFASSDPLVMYRQADVRDRASLDAAVDTAEGVFNARLSGAFHLAGVAAERRFAEETPTTFENVFSPKANGATVLASLVRERCGAEGVLVTFSSVNGLLGGSGASAYSAGNAFVDAFTDRLRSQRQLRCWNIAWSMWDDVGMSRGFGLRDAVRAKGLSILRTDAAVMSLDAILSRPPASVMVGLDARNPHLSRLSNRGTFAIREIPVSRDHRISPRTGAERQLARIWEDLLGVSDIAIDDHFVSLGGHSLKATQLVARVQKDFDTRITLQDVFRVPTVEGLARLIESGAKDAFSAITPVPAAAHYPVSHSQRRLWVIEQMGLAGSAYHIEGGTEIDGVLDPAALERAVGDVVARHESLRTTFHEIDGEPRQVVHAQGSGRLTVVDLRASADPTTAAHSRIRAASDTPFNLATGPLFRATLYRLSDTRSIVIIAMHHIVSDGWSMDVIVRELLENYAQARHGTRDQEREPLRIHYKDFAAWQQGALVAEGSAHRSYWLQALAGELPVVDLPADRPRPPVQSFRGAVFERVIPRDVATAIRAFARDRGATAFMAWLTVVRLLVFKYTRAEDAIIATPVAGREHADLANQVGFYVNMLPLRLSMSPDATAGALIEHVKQTTTAAIVHQLYPYDRLVEELAIRRDAGRNPLFDIVVSVTEASSQTDLPEAMTTRPVELEGRTSKFDATLFFNEGHDGAWTLTVEYNTDLFDHDRIERLAAHVITLADSVGRQPDASCADLDLLPETERHAVADVFPFTRGDYPRNQSIAQVFEAQAASTPDATAIRAATGALTYRELNAKANGLAQMLRERGVRLEETVGVLMAPTESIAIALLGILKAGAAYLPLDPAHPPSRREFMLADAACRIVITDADVDAAAALDQNPGPTPSSLAYVMYTSGSTGQPKGSAIEQRAVLRLVRGADFAQVGSHDRVLLSGSLAFDASTFEIWAPLLNGGCVCIPEARAILDPPTLARLLREWRITTMWCTAGLFNQMVDADVQMFFGLTQLLTGGERLSPPHVTHFVSALPQVRLINGYGPTENTTFTACHTIRETSDRDIPLGRPIANTSVFVLDADLNPGPIGVSGEICAGGDGLARGYVNDPALTAERFVPHPLRPGERLYRTGDAGRWRADGILEFTGRIDDQLKIRGYRVEPGEIEYAIQRVRGVTDAVVVARPTAAGTLELISYVVADAAVTTPGIRAAVAETLPDYMVPARWVRLDRLPLNASHKVDRAALPQPEQIELATPIAPPRSPQERALAQAWGDLLGRTPGIHDNYFEHGGDSIRAIQLAGRLRRSGWRLQVKDVFSHPTIAALATRLEPLADAVTVTRTDTPGPVPMTAAQRWFFAHHHGPIAHFNQSVLLAPRERLAEASLAQALAALIDQHDALRLMFPLRDGTRTAAIRQRGEPAWLERIDVTAAGDADAETSARLDEMHEEFDLERGPLFRAVLIETSRGQRLWLAAHHLIIDGVSWRIIVDQLAVAYRQAAAGRAIDLGEPSASFRDRAEESAQFAGRLEAAATESTAPSAPERDTTYATSEVLAATLSLEDSDALLAAANHAYKTDTNELLIAALGRALGEWSGKDSTVVDLEGHGREPLLYDLDLTRTVGWLTSIYPVALPMHADVRMTIRDVKERLRAIPRKGVEYGIRQYVANTAGAPAVPAVSFNYLGQFDAGSEDTLFAYAPEAAGKAIAGRLNRPHALDIVAIVTGGRMSVSVTAGRDDRTRAQQLLDRFVANLSSVASHCAARAQERTPADFTQRLALDDYDALTGSRGWRHSDIENVCSATPMQEGLLLQSVLDRDSHAYHVQMDYTLTGALEPPRFEHAWFEVCRAHPVLRSAFAYRDLERPLRVVFRERRPPFHWHDLRGLDDAEQASRIRVVREQDLAAGFDFERDPLMRFTVFRLDEERWRIVWSYHHVLLDGWSLGLVLRDFAAAYAAGGEPIASAPDAAAYSEWLSHQDPAAARAWWTNYLAGYDEAAVLPPASPGRDGDTGEVTAALGEEETTAINQVAARWSVTPATLLLAAWGMVLAKYNRRSDVVFGTIVSGRPSALPDADRMVGAFINAVPIRVNTTAGTLRDLAIGLQAELADAERYHHLPLADIQSGSAIGRDLFDHMVIIENYPVERQLADAGKTARMQIERLEAHDRTHYGFSLTVVPGESLTVGLQYDPARHDRARMERTAVHYLNAVRSFATVGALDDVEIMSAEERERVMRAFQPQRRDLGRATIVERFLTQAARTPHNIAVSDAAVSITYGTLANDIATVARILGDAGVGPGDRVGVLLERSVVVPTALFGVMSAGAAYVPLDPTYPAARLELMIRDSGCTVLVSGASSVDRVDAARWRRAATAGALQVFVDADHVGSRAGRVATADDPAYVMYTSGSTGTPKGAVIPHRALASQVQWFIDEFRVTERDRYLQKAPISFDASVEEIYAPLLAGGTVVIPAVDEHLETARLADAIRRERITLLQLVPSQLSIMLDDGWDPADSALRVLFIGSEPLDVSLLARLPAKREFDVVNLYGPTETCDNATSWRWDGRVEGTIPIGVPVTNTEAYVTDERLAPLPPGVFGEIVLAGDNLAIGYHARPELTAERFVFSAAIGTRVYRTGDLGRWVEPGVLECAGRIDQQVKIRGHRIECGEVESQLRLHPAIADCAVVATGSAGQQQLLAFVIANQDLAPSDVRAWLSARVLDAMVPSQFVMLEHLPLMPNGKVDRRSLELQAAAAASSRTASDSIAPRNTAETVIASIWSEVLGSNVVDVRSNFFEAGGHSLKAMQIVSRIHRDLGVRLSLRDLFDHPTVEELAALSRPVDLYGAIAPAPAQETYALSHAQQRLWLLHHIPGGEAAYNMPSAFSVEGTALDIPALETAFAALIDRHEALRTAFVVVDGEARQRILPAVPLKVRQIDLRDAADADGAARELIEQDAVLPFDLTAPPLVRVTVIAMPGDVPRSLLLFTLHHIVGDGWSGEVLEREIATLYDSFRRGVPHRLQPLRIQYKDFSEWQNARSYAADEAWWLSELEHVPERIALPADFDPGEDREFRGAIEETLVDPTVTTALSALAAARGGTLSHAVLALFMLTLNRLSGQDDICVGMSVANRNHPDLEGLIGFFVNLLPVRLRVTDGMELDDLFDRVFTTATAALDRQDYPFDLLVQRLNPHRAATRQPLVNVVYAFQNFTDVRLGGPTAVADAADAPALRPFEFSFRTSKFDLTLFVSNEADGLRLILEYDTGLFSPPTAQRILSLLSRFLRTAARS